MTVINTNTAATITANALTKNERAMSQSMERLSTGQRINSAADDAAGLAISSRMTSQINGLNMAVRNANDAISQIQTADGAYVEVTNMLQRMRELAVQANTGTNSSTDRTALNTEYQALSDEIQRIATNTQWNGSNILDDSAGSSGVVTYQVGANTSQTITVDLGDLGTTVSASMGAITAADGNTGATGVLTVGTVAENDVITVNFDDGTYDQITLTGIEASAINDGSGTAPAFDAGTRTLTDAGALTIAITGAGTMSFTGATTTSSKTFTVSDVSVSRGIHADIAKTDITTVTLATAALSAIDTAITEVNTARSSFGAGINRLEYAADNLSNVSQNTSASRSRILDADYAAETTELARTQIIQQAGTAMLSQANQQAQSVLALLK
ncbi:MAG: flagellin [Porticoccaceae bacterium]